VRLIELTASIPISGDKECQKKVDQSQEWLEIEKRLKAKLKVYMEEKMEG